MYIYIYIYEKVVTCLQNIDQVMPNSIAFFFHL